VGIFAFENYGVPDFYELVLITSQQTVDQQPGKVRRFYQAVEKGTQWTLANPKLSRQAFFRAYPDNANELNKRAFTATLPFFQGSPKQEKSRWRDLQRFMLKKGLIKGQVETGDLVWQP
jgi:putative hydroxymethylpyrimidine transport system substrate-binding protein